MAEAHKSFLKIANYTRDVQGRNVGIDLQTLNLDYFKETCSISDMWKFGSFMVGCDEVQTLQPAELQFLRNLLRAAGGVVVLMGTTTSICGIISQNCERISRYAIPIKSTWCILIKFPQITFEGLKIRSPFFRFPRALLVLGSASC